MDASHEDGKAGLGGILMTSSGVRIGYFSEDLSGDVLNVLNQYGSQNPIFERECFAILCGLSLWKCLLSGCQVIVFGDHEGSIHSMIIGASENRCGTFLITSVHSA